jgi:predicted RNase H-like HicB family nuclease
MTTAIAANPVVLIVEDNARALSLRDAGFTAIGAQSAAAAMREMVRRVIDVVLTDIRLDVSRPNDKSGVRLALEIKESDRDMPVAGYSAVFADSDVERDQGVFDAVWPKGSRDSIEQMDEIIETCRDYAFDHLLRRHEIEYPDAVLMRDLRPGAPGTAPRSESLLGKAGYSLKLVEADGLALPLIVWVSGKNKGVDVQVYEQPALYAHGKTETEAVAQLVELMQLYAEQIEAEPMEATGPALSLTRFLHQRLAEATA